MSLAKTTHFLPFYLSSQCVGIMERIRVELKEDISRKFSLFFACIFTHFGTEVGSICVVQISFLMISCQISNPSPSYILPGEDISVGNKPKQGF